MFHKHLQQWEMSWCKKDKDEVSGAVDAWFSGLLFWLRPVSDVKLSENDDCVHGSFFWTLDTFLSLLSSDDWGDHAPLTPCAWSLTTGGNVSRATRAQAARDHHQLSVGSRHANFSHPWNSSAGDFDNFVRANMPRKCKNVKSDIIHISYIYKLMCNLNQKVQWPYQCHISSISVQVYRYRSTLWFCKI